MVRLPEEARARTLWNTVKKATLAGKSALVSDQQTIIRISALPLSNSMNLGKLFNLSRP